MKSKQEIIYEIQMLFFGNKKLASYAFLLNEQVLDMIWESYIKIHIGTVDINDFDKINKMLEESLGIDLKEYVTFEELLNLYTLSKTYIELLL